MLTLLDISEICSVIQRLNWYNLPTGKAAEKVPLTIHQPYKKVQKSTRPESWTVLKALKYKSCLSFCACQKKIVEFTDSTHTIYWSTNIAKKAAEKNLSIYVSTEYLPI